MEELIKAMSDTDLAELKVKYESNPSVVTLIDGILESREKEEMAIRIRGKFEKAITLLFAKLPHPEDVHNVYARWAEVDVPDGEPEEVMVDGEMVMRTPCHKEFQWVVAINHSVKLAPGATSADSTPKATKRAITVFKREGTTLIPKGNYPSASKACEGLGLTIGGDSAIRVLARDGYITEAYEGTDFTNT